MTEKLYYKDSYLTVCKAEVQDIIYDTDFVLIVLDKTTFFPGGGGQPCDTGMINELIVVEAFEKDGIIFHKLKDKECTVAIGDTVNCGVFYQKRFEYMRAHTGEHILSGVAHNKFGVDNVGFHMDENALMTIDFDKYLDSDSLELIEFSANDFVLKNLKVTAEFFPISEAKKMQYRSKLEFTDDVRIVEIDSVDKCACCAPHLKNTAEAGYIKILSSASHRGGVRLTVKCGMSAYREFAKRYKQVMKISALLCAKHDEADKAVESLIESNKAVKFKQDEIKSEYFEFAASLIEEKDIILQFYKKFSVDDLRNISNLIAAKCSIASVLLSGDDSNGYSYCIYSDRLDMKKFCRAFNSSLNGTGGGKGTMIQGKVRSSASDIEHFIKEMKVEDYENA